MAFDVIMVVEEQPCKREPKTACSRRWLSRDERFTKGDKAVAIHVDTGDYAVGENHSDAARALLARHEPDGRIVTLTIGPPTDADLRLAARMTAGRKR